MSLKRLERFKIIKINTQLAVSLNCPKHHHFQEMYSQSQYTTVFRFLQEDTLSRRTIMPYYDICGTLQGNAAF